MIRYVLAVVLTVAVVATGFVAIDEGSAAKSERQVETSIERIEQTASALAEQEQTPPDNREHPRRFVEIELPGGDILGNAVERLLFERVSDSGQTRVTYRVDGRATDTTVINVPTVSENGEAVDLGGLSGRQTLELALGVDSSGEKVVVLTVRR